MEVCESIWGSFWKCFGKNLKGNGRKNYSNNRKHNKNIVSYYFPLSLPIVYSPSRVQAVKFFSYGNCRVYCEAQSGHGREKVAPQCPICAEVQVAYHPICYDAKKTGENTENNNKTYEGFAGS